MSIESRAGTSNRYLTRTVRQDGRHQRVYLGAVSCRFAQIAHRRRRLVGATTAFGRSQRRREIAAHKCDEPTLIELVGRIKFWKTLRKLRAMKMETTQSTWTAEPPRLPSLQRFNLVCRRAEAGDSVAKLELHQWLRDYPVWLNEVTDLLAIAQDQVIDALAGDDSATKVLLRERLKSDASEIDKLRGDDPLMRIFAEIVVLASLDAKRCQVMALRKDGELVSRKYWASAADRAMKRFERLVPAFQKAMRYAVDTARG